MPCCWFPFTIFEVARESMLDFVGSPKPHGRKQSHPRLYKKQRRETFLIVGGGKAREVCCECLRGFSKTQYQRRGLRENRILSLPAGSRKNEILRRGLAWPLQESQFSRGFLVDKALSLVPIDESRFAFGDKSLTVV